VPTHLKQEFQATRAMTSRNKWFTVSTSWEQRGHGALYKLTPLLTRLTLVGIFPKNTLQARI